MALATKHSAKVPAHYKKRRAMHHRQDKHYLKSYWPYIPMLLVVGSGIILSNLWSSSGSVLGSQSNFSSNSLLSNTNNFRASDGETDLTLSPQLTSAAQAKASDMVARNYWSHNTPDGKTPWTFITATGYNYQQAGENLAYGFSNASQVLSAWMTSPEHRANVLNLNYKNVGFGVASSSDYQGKGPETVVVAEYAEPVSTSVANISFIVPSQSSNTVSNIASSSRLVARIQLLTGGKASWSLAVLSALMGAAIAILIIRHGLRLRKLFIKSEGFLTRHLVIDMVLVIVITACFVLTRASGTIH